MIFTTTKNEKIAVNPSNILFAKTDVRHYKDVHWKTVPKEPGSGGDPLLESYSGQVVTEKIPYEKDYYQIIVIFIDGKSMTFEWETKERRDQLFDELNYLMDRGDK